MPTTSTVLDLFGNSLNLPKYAPAITDCTTSPTGVTEYFTHLSRIGTPAPPGTRSVPTCPFRMAAEPAFGQRRRCAKDFLRDRPGSIDPPLRRPSPLLEQLNGGKSYFEDSLKQKFVK
ncbi:MAG: hypothetical protein R3F40_05055 [Candidatus Competibacteraceae bacterium]